MSFKHIWLLPSFFFTPDRFVESALGTGLSANAPDPGATREDCASTHCGQREGERKDLSELTEVVRRAVSKGWSQTIITVVSGILAGWLANRAGLTPDPTIIVLLQLVAAAVLLAPTLCLAGWEAQTVDGESLPEQLNRFIYRVQYMLGSFLLVFALAWKG